MALREFIRTQKAAAKYAGVDPRTIRRWEKDGRLEKTQGGYSKAELLSLITPANIKISRMDVVKLYTEIEIIIDGLDKIRAKLKELSCKRQ